LKIGSLVEPPRSQSVHKACSGARYLVRMAGRTADLQNARGTRTTHSGERVGRRRLLDTQWPPRSTSLCQKRMHCMGSGSGRCTVGLPRDGRQHAPPLAATSMRAEQRHNGEKSGLLFLQIHPGDRGALHCYWNATQHNLNKFRFRPAAFSPRLKSKVGLAAAKRRR